MNVNKALSAVNVLFYRPIESENKGRMLLEKMGWVDGEGLGRSKTGRTEPVSYFFRPRTLPGPDELLYRHLLIASDQVFHINV